VRLYGLFTALTGLFLSLFRPVTSLTFIAFYLSTDRGLTDTNGIGSGLLAITLLL